MLRGRRSVPSASWCGTVGTTEQRRADEGEADNDDVSGRQVPAGRTAHREAALWEGLRGDTENRLTRLARRTRVTRGECAIVSPTLGNTMSTRLIWLPNPYLSSSIVAAATASSKESPFLRDSPARPTQVQRPQCQGRLNLALPRGAARSRRTQRRNGPASLPVVAVWPNIPTRRDKSYSGHLCSKMLSIARSHFPILYSTALDATRVVSSCGRTTNRTAQRTRRHHGEDLSSLGRK